MPQNSQRVAEKMLRRIAPLLIVCFATVSLGEDFIPRRQNKPPGPPLSPEQAIKRMTVPEGFSVELVASEPDIVNPVAMTIDERGRFWITESLEYPRRAPGKGRDRVKVLEDTTGDGKADKVTIFAEGLNIPSGIAVGHGGVWVANSPDILFMRDTDGDGKADESKVVVSGFGRTDTHELPNSLIWGPDGWLYGLNGVFNYSHVKHRGQEHRFTCTMFRINPRADEDGPWKGTHDFELFCEGTSNPWGITFDKEGSAFISACVIDHLWHLTESGYYHRQGGPYPPFTWKIESIVKHRHQMAAYCGIHYFDSDAYPPEYRERLYMGNIHGGCINVDELTRAGSTYFGKGKPDFLTANDVWFMPVVQKTGPDGCLYVLDWYDRYHCYQDANRDPKGIDRLNGRLYRVRYKDTPRAPRFDLAKETDAQLVERLHSPNVYYRDIAQRILAERADDKTRKSLQQLVLNDAEPRKTRLHALWALTGGGPLDSDFHLELLGHEDPTFRAWGVRVAGNMREVASRVRDQVVDLVGDPSLDVVLQVAIAAKKIDGIDSVPLLLSALARAGEDPLLPRIVWQNLHPMLDSRADDFFATLETKKLHDNSAVAALLPRVIDRLLASKNADPASLVQLFVTLQQSGNDKAARLCLERVAQSMQTRQIAPQQIAKLRPKLEAGLKPILTGSQDHPLFLDAALLATTWNDAAASRVALQVLQSGKQSNARRIQALEALVAAKNENVLGALGKLLTSKDNNPQTTNLRRLAIAGLGRLDDPEVATLLLSHYAQLEPTVRPVVAEVLTQRVSWAKPLLAAIRRDEIPRDALNLTQIRKLIAAQDRDVLQQVEKIWGSIRTDRDPKRALVIDRVRKLVRENLQEANLVHGQELYTKKCAVCHTFQGKGEKIGPDITVNGRSSFEQLLSNVLDPNLVIGPDYQARIVITTDGRTLTGLLAEENDQRVVLKMQGGKIETIARRDVEELAVSKVSLMPENLEQDLSDKDLLDLMAYVARDVSGGDQAVRWIRGTRRLAARDIVDASRYHEILDQFAPGFSTARVGEKGLGIVGNHFGRAGVLRTHPVDRKTPCVLTSKVDVPKGKRTYLVLSVSHEAGDGVRDWQLVVKANGKVLHQSVIGAKSGVDHWTEVAIDLSQFAGQRVQLDLANKATDWSWEFAYWDRIEVVSQ